VLLVVLWWCWKVIGGFGLGMAVGWVGVDAAVAARGHRVSHYPFIF